MTLVDAERKSLDAIVEDADTDKPHGGFTAVLSTPSLDRDGDVLSREEWITPLPERLPLDMDHDMTVAGTIGSFRPYFDDSGRLMMDATFASTPKAQEVRTLVKEGHVGSVSVAFLTDRSKKDGTPRRELLNAGVVAIPSNRDAVILNAKSATAEVEVDAVKDAAVKFLAAVAAGVKGAGSGDGALIQAIHDAAGHLGATCVVVEVEPAESSPADKAEDAKEKAAADVAEVKDAAVDVELPSGISLDQFKAALDHITSGASDGAVEPQGISPADPVVDTAVEAAAVEAPADAPVDAAGEAAESVVLSSETRARNLAMQIFAQTVLSD